MTYKKSSKDTTQITPNWFKSGDLTTPGITQENQFSSTRGLRYGPLRINKTGIFVNNGTLDSTIITETGFHGYGLSGIEQITLDASTGLQVTDGSNSVLQAVVSGTNVGDVTIGGYSSGYGAFYDKSASKFYIKGTLEAVDGSFTGSISIGSGDNIFKADGNGIYLGNATFGSAPFRVNMSGALTATNATITGTINSTSGSIGGWTIGSTTLYNSNVELGSGIVLGNSSLGIAMVIVDNVPYITFSTGGTVKGLMTATTAGHGGIRIYGDCVVNNNKSFLCEGTSGYGSLGVDSSNNYLLICPNSNEFFIKSSNSDTSYFHTTNSHLYLNSRSSGRLYLSGGGGVEFNTSSSNKVKYSNCNIDMGNNNIDECTTIWAYNFSNRSDSSLKKNIKSSLKHLDLLSKLNPVTFNWKIKSYLDKKSHHGLIAQEVEKILPELVTSDENGVKAINYFELIPILIGSIKELQKEVTDLKKIN